MPTYAYGGEVVGRATRSGGSVVEVSKLWRRTGGSAVEVADWSGGEDPGGGLDAVTVLRQMFTADAAERVWEADTGGFTDRSSNAAGTKAGTSITTGQASLLADGSGSSIAIGSGGFVDTAHVHNHTTASTLIALFRADSGAVDTTTSRVYTRGANMTLNWGHVSNAAVRYAAEVTVGATNLFPKWSTTAAAVATPTLVMVTFDGSNARTYRATTADNGALIATAAASGSLASSASGGRIGNHTAATTQSFPGRIQYVAVLPTALSLTRFQAYAAATFTA